ncbi:MAG: YpdA family putative bacillithiol disulfide reductase [Bacteroidetes bacterium]|nr:YpdA family putative bacillithiol disulfide reductase [Bacteroidota bacterium]MBU2045224.1 YpdA family putative bacillithiol disulfide reductase [Bacteroidota bacterium]MBU2267885.1 YpdA family putative bacillithiol disulfide reductase [Bacteroidota bacterium]MBU2375008.1 YpdA family putative bacillithiol disulfide reductase [Bacteroidota bacterium]
MEHFDIIIIGGGPIGLTCGIKAKEAGLTYLIIEKGCLVNSIYNYPQNMTFFSTSEKLEIGGVPFVSNNPKPTRSEALEYYRRIALKFELNIHLFEEVLKVYTSKNFMVKTSKGDYQANNIVLSTGFYDLPALMDIPGESLSKVSHYYNDPHYYAMQKLVVVGASNSSVDAALECYRKGAEVSMVIRGDEVGERVKYWVRPDIVNRIKEGSIKAYFNSNLKEVRNNEVDIETPDGKITIANDFVLALTGYQPNFDFLDKVGVELSSDGKKYPQHNTQTMETNKKGLYLAGVVCGGMDTHLWFIENSREHADLIVENILSEQKFR